MKIFLVPLWVMVLAVSTAMLSVAEAAPQQVTKYKLHKLKHRAGKHFRLKHRHRTATGKNADNLEADAPKPLDLDVPFKSFDSQPSKDSTESVTDSSDSTLFAGSNTKQSGVELKGQVVMSQEPEADKRKSIDGAGIMIDFRR
jgi:hypothetical protein